MVDYSKWDNIDLSDDEGEDCHPNIDKRSWIKWKKESRMIKKEEDKKRREMLLANHQERLKQISTLEKEGDPENKLPGLRKEAKEFEEQQKKEEEMRKKYPLWDEENICHEGFSKTIINKGSSHEPPLLNIQPKSKEAKKAENGGTSSHPPSSAPSAPSGSPSSPKDVPMKDEAEGAKKVEKEKEGEEEGEEEEEEGIDEDQLDDEQKKQVDEYVKQMEFKAHKFAVCKTFEEYFEVIKEYPEIVCEETHQYLLLHSSDFLKSGEDELSKHYLRGACIVNYSLELGKDGISLFFARMRDSNPRWRVEFERDTIAYWHRIRQKYIELGKIPPPSSNSSSSSSSSSSSNSSSSKSSSSSSAKPPAPAKIEDDLD